MSLFLLQIPTTSTVQPNDGVTNLVAAKNSGDALDVTFSEILSNAAKNLVSKLNANSDKGEKSQQTKNQSADTENYFTEIVNQLKLELPEDNSLTQVNVGELPNDIKNIADETKLINEAIKLLSSNEAQQATEILPTNATLEPTNTQSNDAKTNEIKEPENSPNDLVFFPIFMAQDFMQTKIVAVGFNQAIAPKVAATELPANGLNIEPNSEEIAGTSSVIPLITNTNDASIEVSDLQLQEIELASKTDIDLSGGNADDFAQNMAKSAPEAISIDIDTTEITQLNSFSLDAAIIDEQMSQNSLNGEQIDLPEIVSGVTTIETSNIRASKEIPLIRVSNFEGAENHSPLEQISIQIKKLHGAKKGEIALQLNPKELGKVDISLKSDANDNVFVQITTDLRDTYDLLRADKVNLERILHDTGLKFENNSLQFAHRDGEQPTGKQHNPNAQMEEVSNNVLSVEDEAQIMTQEQVISLSVSTGINIRV